MNDIKKLTITNCAGEIYDLMLTSGVEGVHCHQLSGFGYESKGTYSQIGNSFLELDYYFSQHNPKGTFVFWSERPHKLYYDFMRFLSDRPLTICAVNFADVPYYLDVNVKSVSKDAGGSNKAVFAEITFEALGLFYSDTSPVSASSDDADTYKPTYPINAAAYGLPDSLFDELDYLNSQEVKECKAENDFYIYPSTKFGKEFEGTALYLDGDTVTHTKTSVLYMPNIGKYPSSATTYVQIISDSPLESPCKVEIFADDGDVVNPIWYHYCNNALVGSGRYNGTIQAGNHLVIDTTSEIYTIKELNSSNVEIADRYESCDFSTDRFMFVNCGTNIYSVSQEGTNSASVTVSPRIEYESV